MRCTPLRLKLLRAANKYDLAFLDAREEKCAFKMSEEGLLYLSPFGSADYIITPEGREVLAVWEEKDSNDAISFPPGETVYTI